MAPIMSVISFWGLRGQHIQRITNEIDRDFYPGHWAAHAKQQRATRGPTYYLFLHPLDPSQLFFSLPFLDKRIFGRALTQISVPPFKHSRARERAYWNQSFCVKLSAGMRARGCEAAGFIKTGHVGGVCTGLTACDTSKSTPGFDSLQQASQVHE